VSGAHQSQVGFDPSRSVAPVIPGMWLERQLSSNSLAASGLPQWRERVESAGSIRWTAAVRSGFRVFGGPELCTSALGNSSLRLRSPPTSVVLLRPTIPDVRISSGELPEMADLALSSVTMIRHWLPDQIGLRHFNSITALPTTHWRSAITGVTSAHFERVGASPRDHRTWTIARCHELWVFAYRRIASRRVLAVPQQSAGR